MTNPVDVFNKFYGSFDSADLHQMLTFSLTQYTSSFYMFFLFIIFVIFLAITIIVSMCSYFRQRKVEQSYRFSSSTPVLVVLLIAMFYSTRQNIFE